MTPDIDSVLAGVEALKGKTSHSPAKPLTKAITAEQVIAALSEFTECVRYLNTRRSKGALLQLDDEAAVQDTLYLMLRPWIRDLVGENPTDKVGNRYSIKDFLTVSNHIVVEAKFVRNADHGRGIVKELNDDIETYRHHQHCDHLIFFVYDPNGNIPDVASLVRHISDNRVYNGKTLHCHIVVKP